MCAVRSTITGAYTPRQRALVQQHAALVVATILLYDCGTSVVVLCGAQLGLVEVTETCYGTLAAFCSI
jgi:hypothetical protein